MEALFLAIVKLFACDTSIFSVVSYISVSADQMNKDLEKISKWAYQWKIFFNPDISKPTHLLKEK